MVGAFLVAIEERPRDRIINVDGNKPANFLTVRHPDETIQARCGTMKIPESYLIDRLGGVRAKFISNQDWTSQEIVVSSPVLCTVMDVRDFDRF